MEQTVLTEKNMSEIQNVKGMAQKNVAEKVSHQKLQRQIDKQKKAFVKQHSKDENVLLLIRHPPCYSYIQSSPVN
jgi:hypothetical protein